MRILILSNFYPPSRSWGYTQLCHEVCRKLVERGHTLAVLTSNYPSTGPQEKEIPVYRRLHLESDPLHYRPLSLLTRPWRQEQNRRALLETAARFRPDVVFIWGLWNMSTDVAAAAERLPATKVVYYISDHWPVHDTPHDVYWRLPGRRWLTRAPKAAANRLALAWLDWQGRDPALQFERAICVSETLRQSLVEKGAPLQQAAVIYNGIDVAAFSRYAPGANGRQPDTCLRLLYAGRLSHDKGVHTAIAALARLVHDEGYTNASLAIAGDGAPGYVASLKRLVSQRHLDGHVTFHGLVARERMPGLLSHCDVLVFPSIAAEALPRMPQEAMACGLIVVGTITGGTRELLLDGETGLTFPPDDDETLCNQLLRLAREPELRRRLAEAGRQTILEKFTMERMVDEIEYYLEEVEG
jgi:glycogen synthase